MRKFNEIEAIGYRIRVTLANRFMDGGSCVWLFKTPIETLGCDYCRSVTGRLCVNDTQDTLMCPNKVYPCIVNAVDREF